MHRIVPCLAVALVVAATPAGARAADPCARDVAVSTVSTTVNQAVAQVEKDDGFNFGRFMWGLAKGAATGLVIGAGAVVVAATAPVWVTVALGGAAVAVAGYGVYQITQEWPNMTGGDKSELAGELVGGLFTGGVGSRVGTAIIRVTSRAAAAKSLLSRPLTAAERDALERAHDVGKPGEHIGNYGAASLREKTRILTEGGFSVAERRALIESGLAGRPPPRTGVDPRTLSPFEKGRYLRARERIFYRDSTPDLSHIGGGPEIGLALGNHYGSLPRGPLSYKGDAWRKSGMTPWEADRPGQFTNAFWDVVRKTEHVHFSLDGMSFPKAVALGQTVPKPGQTTAWEMLQVMQHVPLRNKTSFYWQGEKYTFDELLKSPAFREEFKVPAGDYWDEFIEIVLPNG